MRPVRLLGLSGSLRAASTNTALLRAAAAADVAEVTLSIYEGLRELPIFDPDLDDGGAPGSVHDLRARVGAADGLVIACPEYAHGIPGGLKNALDWLVSGSEIPGKPVALFHASTRSQHGRAALMEVLRTMSAVPTAEFTLHLLGRSPDDVARILEDPAHAVDIADALATFSHAIRRSWIEASGAHISSGGA